ncbi:hypothetical protein RJT34_03660 [Clitoria ternatea]|uniref:Protein NO VEIN C-terminal domain-containing protein n=1 Tax=Clitoria ternatea TaxID=43366 RepID=A0AAN9Q1G1_CLITE
MYGQPPRFRGGPRHPPPPPQQQQQHQHQYQYHSNVFFQPQPSFSPLNFNTNTPWPFPPQPPPTQPSQDTKLAIDLAAANATRDLLAAGESVSAWKVSQNALLSLQIDSWNSLGFKMQQIPSLNRIMITEGKVNAFVHCFVEVRKITSLYDLEVALCKYEGVNNFEALGLGPLLRHPLVIHYFSLPSHVTQVCKITSGEIIQLLSEYLDDSKSSGFVKVEQFLDFIAQKRSVECKGWLGIRIQNLGMHITAIREARNSEQSTLGRCLETLRFKKEFPISSSQKKKLDERFNVIAQRVESFSPVKKSYCGKHIRFNSSSSDDEDSLSDYSSDDQNNNIITGSRSNPSSQFAKSSERVSSCPYPSATEEMARLGVRGDMKGHFTKSSEHVSSCPYPSSTEAMAQLGVRGDMKGHSLANSNVKEPPKKKRKSDSVPSTKSAPSKLRKKKKFRTKGSINKDEDFSITNEALQMFVTTWKEACREHKVAEVHFVDLVLERMLESYEIKLRRRRRIRMMLSSYPFIGLLNAARMRHVMWDLLTPASIDAYWIRWLYIWETINAHYLTEQVSSIKSGMWNSICDSENAPVIKDSTENTKDNSENTNYFVLDVTGICSDDVIRKIGTYFTLDNEIYRNSNSIMLLRKFCNCESWVAEQFGMKSFDSLGYGDFLSFVEKYVNQLPHELLKLLVGGDTCENSSFKACMSSTQLITLVSQALSSLWENETVTKQMISMLLIRQFPSISFELVENGSLEELLITARGQQSHVISKSVVFSATLVEKNYNGDLLYNGDNDWSVISTVRSEMSQKTRSSETVAKNAIEVLLKSPMLSDLSKWSQWDLRFAPFLGSLISWLSNDVNTKELLCLVTRDGKVIRIDHFATMDSFLDAALQGSSFQTALHLLSLISLVGGEKNVPLSLLKCHACHAFEVMFRNSLEDIDISHDGNALQPEEASSNTEILTEISTTKMRSGFSKHMHKVSKVVSILSRFVLDCLGNLPAEFHSFASDVLLSGMQSVFKDSASAILCECSNMEQRFMLHEVGLSRGISEWINDYHAFISNETSDLCHTHVSCLKDAKTDVNISLKHDRETLDQSPISEANMVTSSQLNRRCTEITQIDDREKSNDEFNTGCIGNLFQHEDMDAALFIESIRRDEFGLDSSLSDIESRMLKKQHARLGRALHCLSQELYSQDSHFILELVQNADDNNYPENVEPTLTFILQDSGIVVLNNEQGFSAENMRALCDVGNSTKKGSNAGYIGKKGIGFKSVFRVTDAPEIHSNGFHVKFDISEGQIGFVLPTVVPACDIGLLNRMASTGTELHDDNPWNTCILLPFRSNLSEGTSMNSVMTMFSDLHPSLLLFLHRLKCIKLRNLLNDTFVVMKKEILGDGIIKVSHGKEKMAWFVVSQKLQTNSIRFDVRTTEISMAFTLQESDNGYIACLDQQPVFAFLPLRTYGLKFILQGDFVLPSSREEVDGDSPWNQWLLSEYPNLFVRAQREFCELPCFRSEPGKGLSAFMSFVPLVGEVHGFFSSLPRLIISKLRIMNCLLVEGDKNGWAPPCKVLRGWTEQVCSLLPDNMLHEHLGLRYLDKNVVLSDTLARALGIEEFGPNILVRVLSSLCHTKNGLKSMDMSWLASCLNTLYVTMFNTSDTMSNNFEIREDIIRILQKTPFIPLSDGTYSSVDEGTIWLQSNTLNAGFNGEHKLEALPNICAKLRTISPSLFSVSYGTPSMSMALLDNVTRLLRSIGVQQLSGHDVVKLHILPAMSDETMAKKNKMLMIEYVCFVMLHLNSTCSDCFIEREHIISELRGKSLLLTNFGFKCPAEVQIHFCTGLGNPVTSKMLADGVNMRWHELDISYLKHPVNESVSSALTKWREFFEKIGITDFAQMIQVDKSVVDVCDAAFKRVMWDRGLISTESMVKDWESPELVQLVSLLSKSGNLEICKYFLEVLDTLWDACYSDKTTCSFNFKSIGDGHPFKSTFICSLCDVRWVVSTMDGELHYPKDVFYDCEAVRMILGDFAPYAVPKVKSERLVKDVGFKTRVTLSDILDILRAWRKSSKTRFKASITQMSKLYAFIWNEIAASKHKTMEDLMSGPFIFIPDSFVCSHEDVVCGMFVYPNEVYWHDSTGSVQQVRESHPQDSSSRSPINKSLCTFYPSLHGFFVDECGVQDAPSLCSYIQILLQLSTVALPSQAADKIYQVFLKWADGLKSGLLSVEDITYLKECLSKLEFPVLPTVQDKWVSLHPSFGLVCWCDDKKLKKEFKDSENLDFLYFGELTEDDKEMVQEKVSILMKNLGIPAISEVVTREPIYYGLADCSLKESLINWTLPYAQRYIHKLHSDKYVQLKLSGFDIFNHLKVIVVQKLFYRNIIKTSGSASKKRVECSCLLQGNILYTIQESDYHSLFMELSRLLLDGTSELHLANFLHMITTMAESGSSEEQIEFFILTSQKVPKLPDEEPIWALSSASSPVEADMPNPSDHATYEQIFPRKKGKVSSNWPPVDWKTAPDFNYARVSGFKTQPTSNSSFSEVVKDDNSKRITAPPVCAEQGSVTVNWTIEEDLPASSVAVVLHENENLEDQSYRVFEPTAFSIPTDSDPVGLDEAVNENLGESHLSSSVFSKRDRLHTGTFDAAQAKVTGRLGEFLACKYFIGKAGKTSVRWVNEVHETGLPYDLVIGEDSNEEFIEVKATRSLRKDWFNISLREWQYAKDKGGSFSIAFVVILANNVARITIFKDPVKLCQLGELQLAVLMPRQQKQFSVVS